MAKLSKDEEGLLKRLQAKLDAPDVPSIGRSITAHINFGNPEEVALAIKHGFLDSDDDDDDDDDDDKDKKPDEKPGRKGFFE